MGFHHLLSMAVLVLAVLLTNMTPAQANVQSEFISADKQRVAEVELFEFDDPLVQKKAISLAKQLRCPQCQNQNLVESNSPIAQDLKLVVFKMMNEGKSEQQVIDYMTERFGDFVLYKPKLSLANALLWGLPFLCAVIFFLLSLLRIRRSTAN
ncbi:MAG: cytochrome c-type biogenesis protein [Vibrio sp.]|uniref:cytochrome c-type biogenesis protein n=1 Tax=Vibrio sp. TaxID=678 RepID=UPI003A89E57D